jgi:hypothetical protein
MPGSNSEGVALKPYFIPNLSIPVTIERVKHIFKKENNEWIEITQDHQKYKETEGEYCVLKLNNYEKSKWFAGYSYVDLLKPGVSEKFIEITMHGYEKVAGDEFGKRVPGVFTDEPNTNTRRAGPIRYTPDLYEQFEKQWGYRLEPHIMSLIRETGNWKKVRHNYQSTILQLFIDRWSKPWYEYTETNNLQWTGHYWEHGWPSPKEGPDNMAMYAWHQTPGVDMLFNAEKHRPDQFGNIRNVKELSSVVNQFNRHRALSETYGAAGWELTFDDMKRLGDWEYVLGVNLMVQHLAYMSLAGDRKHDFPQSFGAHAPYWGLYRYQADYFARLSLALSSGYQKNKILVIEPTTTAWMYYNPAKGQNEEMYAVKEKFEPFLVRMEKYQLEYDLGCENIIKDHGKVDDNKIVINKAAYDVVILPPGLENLDKTTVELLSAFLQQGGRVVQAGTNPGFVDGETYNFDKLQASPGWTKAEVNSDLFQQLNENIDMYFVHPESWGGNVFHQRRVFDDGQLLFLTNFHRNETAYIYIRSQGKSVKELDAQNGSTKAYPFFNEQGEVNFQVELPPSGSKLLFVSNSKGKIGVEVEYERELLETNEPSVERLTKNILNLDYVRLTLNNKVYNPMYFYSAGTEIWKAHGYPDNPWVSASQFKTELVDADTFKTGSGFTIEYSFFVRDKAATTGMKLVVERPWLYSVELNGVVTNPLENEFWLDKDFRVFQIGNKVKEGKNKVTITADPFSMFCELEPVYVLGDFAVLPVDKGFEIGKKQDLGMGSWKEQGMPFYGQTVAYTKTINVKHETEIELELGQWEGTVAEVLLDGKHQGIIYSQPYTLKFPVSFGEHDVTVRVVGSLKNTLGPHHNVNRRGIVTPWSFKYAPETQPSGKEYDLLDYGLMENFKIYRLVVSDN